MKGYLCGNKPHCGEVFEARVLGEGFWLVCTRCGVRWCMNFPRKCLILAESRILIGLHAMRCEMTHGFSEETSYFRGIVAVNSMTPFRLSSIKMAMLFTLPLFAVALISFLHFWVRFNICAWVQHVREIFFVAPPTQLDSDQFHTTGTYYFMELLYLEKQ